MEFRAGDVVNHRGFESKYRVLSVAGDRLELESDSGVKQCGTFPSSNFDIVRRVVHVGDVLVGTRSREAWERIRVTSLLPENFLLPIIGDALNWDSGSTTKWQAFGWVHEDGTPIEMPRSVEPRMPEVAVANATATKPVFTAEQWARFLFDADPIVLADIRRHADVESVLRETTTTLQYEGRPRVDVLEIRVEVTDRVRAALDRAWEKDIGGRRTYWTNLCEQAVGR